MNELCDLDAVEQRRLLRRREIRPIELLDSCLARIDAVNPRLNAVVTRNDDAARAAALAAEKAMGTDQELGPLHGLPVAVKDVHETAGLRTTYGSPLFRDYRPGADAAIVGSLRRAGAIIIGKTNTPEFAAGAHTVNDVFGATANPFDVLRSCGGSSGGSAVALATGMAPLATGTDMGGSLRIPAAWTGTVGFRGTPGTVPADRRLGWMPIDVPGPMARSVGDISLMLAALRWPGVDPLHDGLRTYSDGLPPAIDLSSLDIAVSVDLGSAPVGRGIRRTFQDAVSRFSGAFRRCEAADPDLAEAHEVFDVLRALSFVAEHQDKLDTAELGPNVRSNVEHGLRLDPAATARAFRLHGEIYRSFAAFMRGYDALICPTVAVSPFPIEEPYVRRIDDQRLDVYFHWLALTYLLTVTGHPVICIPCGVDGDGMPFGIQVCGRMGDDARLLTIAGALESHLAAIGLGRSKPQV